MTEKQLLGDAIIPSSKSELLRDEHYIAPLVVPNILQEGDTQQEKEKVKIIEKDEITDVPCKDEEGNDHIAQEDTTENEKKGNEYHPISTKVENLIDGLNHSSNRAIVEQQFVDPFVGLPLSQVDLSAAPCDKYEMYADHLYLCHNIRMRFMFPILIHMLVLKLSICCPLLVKMMS